LLVKCNRLAPANDRDLSASFTDTSCFGTKRCRRDQESRPASPSQSCMIIKQHSARRKARVFSMVVQPASRVIRIDFATGGANLKSIAPRFSPPPGFSAISRPMSWVLSFLRTDLFETFISPRLLSADGVCAQSPFGRRKYQASRECMVTASIAFRSALVLVPLPLSAPKSPLGPYCLYRALSRPREGPSRRQHRPSKVPTFPLLANHSQR
jgi:hypothetical protein